MRITSGGTTWAQYLHLIDVLSTVLEAARIPPPASVNGVTQQKVDGVSALPTLTRLSAPETRVTQYYEMHANRAIHHDDWVAARRSGNVP